MQRLNPDSVQLRMVVSEQITNVTSIIRFLIGWLERKRDGS